MRDKESSAHIEFFLEFFEQLDDLRLNRHVHAVVGSSAMSSLARRPAPWQSSPVGASRRSTHGIAIRERLRRR